MKIKKIATSLAHENSMLIINVKYLARCLTCNKHVRDAGGADSLFVVIRS